MNVLRLYLGNYVCSGADVIKNRVRLVEWRILIA